jgi:hypothetical protein
MLMNSPDGDFQSISPQEHPLRQISGGNMLSPFRVAGATPNRQQAARI